MILTLLRTSFFTRSTCSVENLSSHLFSVSSLSIRSPCMSVLLKWPPLASVASQHCKNLFFMKLFAVFLGNGGQQTMDTCNYYNLWVPDIHLPKWQLDPPSLPF